MFQFPTFALGNGFLSRSVPRFGDPRLKCLRTANRGFSQLITSFVASQRQGIHRLLFVACSPYLHPNVARTCSGGPDCAFFQSSTSALGPPCGAWGGWLPCGGWRRGANHWVVATRATVLVGCFGVAGFSAARLAAGRRARSLVFHCETGFQRALAGVPEAAKAWAAYVAVGLCPAGSALLAERAGLRA